MDAAFPREHLVPKEFLDFIKNGEKFLVAGHENPDGDCVGSQIALVSVLRRLGKEAIPCSAGPFNRAEIKPYKSLFSSNKNLIEKGFNETPFNGTGLNETTFRVILLDCSSLDRTGDISGLLEGRPLAIIDHHDTRDAPPPAGNPCYFDVNAPSTTFMIMRIIAALGLEISREEAEILFFGLCTDTGFFRHVERDAAEVFGAALALIRLGANPKAAYSAIYGGKSLNSRRLIGQTLARAESLFSGKLILTTEGYEEIKSFGLENWDSDSLYGLLQSVAGVEAIVIIRQETPETCIVGLRSRSAVDVGSIAGQFGGGGHKNASGFSLKGTISETREKIIKVFEGVFA